PPALAVAASPGAGFDRHHGGQWPRLGGNRRRPPPAARPGCVARGAASCAAGIAESAGSFSKRGNLEGPRRNVLRGSSRGARGNGRHGEITYFARPANVA